MSQLNTSNIFGEFISKWQEEGIILEQGIESLNICKLSIFDEMKIAQIPADLMILLKFTCGFLGDGRDDNLFALWHIEKWLYSANDQIVSFSDIGIGADVFHFRADGAKTASIFFSRFDGEKGLFSHSAKDFFDLIYQ